MIKVRVFKTFNRYVVVIGHDWYTMSDNPLSFNQYGGELDDISDLSYFGNEIALSDCPQDVKVAIAERTWGYD